MTARFIAPGWRGGPGRYIGRHRAPRIRATMPLRLGVLSKLLGADATHT
jgi:hypothetical protein